MTEYLITVVGELTAAAIIAVLGILVGYLFAKNKYRQSIDAAGKVYVKRLGNAIDVGVLEGVDKALENARVIVGMRNDVRGSLVSLSSILNSEIDELEIGVRGYHEFVLRESGPFSEERRMKSEQAYELISVLKKKWPVKSDQIEFGIRKVIAELGLDKI